MYKISFFLVCCLALIQTDSFGQRNVILQSLKIDSDKFKMKGLAFWQANKKVSFGNYTISDIKRSGTVGSTTTFQNDNNGYVKSKQSSRIKFSISDQSSTALVESKFQLNDLEISLFKNKISIPFDYSKSFFGTIQIGTNSTWDYIVETQSDVIDGLKNGGIAKDKNGLEINIVPFNGAEANALAKLTNISYAFKMNNEIIGGTNARGEVWLKKEIDNNLKLVVSSLATIITFQYLNNIN